MRTFPTSSVSLPVIGLVALSLAFSSCAQAATYHVSASGDDSRSPGQAQQVATPWRTLQKAADRALAGDTVLVAPGTYAESLKLSNKNGTAQKWITFRGVGGQGGEKPLVVGTANAEGYGSSIAVADSSFLAFENFELRTHGLNTVGFGVERSHHVRVVGCDIHDNGQGGFASGQSDYLFVERNVVYNNSFTGVWHGSGISLYQNQASDNAPGFHSIVRGNVCFNNRETEAITAEHTDGNGIIIDDFHNTQKPKGNGVNYAPQTLVENNVCYNNGAKGIQVYLSDHVTVRGNTCYWNNTDSGPHSGGTWRGELNNSMSSDNLWENNIAIANPAFNKENTAIVIAALKGYSSTGIVFKNNLTFNGTPGQPSVRVDLGNWPAPELVKTSDGNRLGVDPKIPRPNVSLNFKGISASPTRSSSTPGQQGQK